MAEEPRHPIFSFLGCMTVCYAVAFVGAEGTYQGLGGWYLVLDKPSWTPPMGVFAPVWTVLYGLMGWSLWMIWRSEHRSRVAALVVFGLQLVLNCAWSWLFFAGHLLFWSCVEILVLLVGIALTGILFFRIRRVAVAPLIPYFLWIAFASALCFQIWQLNPKGAGIQTVSVSP